MHTDCRGRHAPGVDSHGSFSQEDLWRIWKRDSQWNLLETVDGFSKPNLIQGMMQSAAGAAPQLGQSLRELFPSPCGLFSVSGWNRVRCIWRNRSALSHTPEHTREAKKTGSKFLNAQGKNSYIKWLFKKFLSQPSMSALLSPLLFILVNLHSSKHCPAELVHTQGRKTHCQGKAFEHNLWHAHPVPVSTGGAEGLSWRRLVWARLWGLTIHLPTIWLPEENLRDTNSCYYLSPLTLPGSIPRIHLLKCVPKAVLAMSVIPHPWALWICRQIFHAQHTNISPLASSWEATSSFLLFL